MRSIFQRVLSFVRGIVVPAPRKVNFQRIPLGINDEFYPDSHRFGPDEWWTSFDLTN